MRSDLAQVGYAGGVPMGGDLTRANRPVSSFESCKIQMAPIWIVCRSLNWAGNLATKKLHRHRPCQSWRSAAVARAIATSGRTLP